MNPNPVLMRDGKKFMWDGRALEKREEAAGVAESYQKDNFEACVIEEGSKFLVYSRRVVKEGAPTGQ